MIAGPHRAKNSAPPPLLDRRQRPLRDLRISVTDRCNFRCPYCMPAELYGEAFRFLPREELLSFEEIERIARVAISHGVKKLRITGGEPLLRADLPDLIRRLAALTSDLDIALTTNGMLLPQATVALKEAGLHRITISLDSLHPEVFRQLSGGRGSPAQVLAGLEAAERAGFGALKINCVVQRGVNDEAPLALAERFRGTPHIVRFIEFMDVGTLNGWRFDRVIPARELIATIGARYPLIPLEPTTDGEVARRYGYADGAGEIGLITSVTQPFCSGCTRARLSTEGRLVTCLFASDGLDLRAPLRAGADDQTLSALFSKVWGARDDAYSEQRAKDNPSAKKLEMFRLGG